MEQKTVTFSNGSQVLALGQGTWNMGKSLTKKTEEIKALRCGIELGMNLIDTAEMYDNEEMIGEAISGIRHKVFLVSKVLPSNASIRGTIQACERSLKKLQTDYLDLYLLHWRGSYSFEDTVTAMQQLVHAGKIRMWGVSNMDVPQMEEFFALPYGNTCAANQVAYNLQTRGIEYDLLRWSHEKNMPVMAYSPVGEGKLTEHYLLKEIARNKDATPSQIALAWVMRNPGMIAIPKAGCIKHVEENYKSISLELTTEDIEKLDNVFLPPTRKMPFVGW